MRTITCTSSIENNSANLIMLSLVCSVSDWDGGLPRVAHRPFLQRSATHSHLPSHRQLWRACIQGINTSNRNASMVVSVLILNCLFSKVDEHGIPKTFESSRIHAAALVVGEYSSEYSHWEASRSLGEWLKEEGVPGIAGE